MLVRAVASGGPVVPGPPFEIGAPHFTFGPPVAAYIQYCILKMCPPMLLNPGDGPDAGPPENQFLVKRSSATVLVLSLSFCQV